MISRRTILGFIGSAATVIGFKKLNAVPIEPITVSFKPVPQFASGGIVNAADAADSIPVVLSRGELFVKTSGGTTWIKLGDVKGFEITPRMMYEGLIASDDECPDV